MYEIIELICWQIFTVGKGRTVCLKQQFRENRFGAIQIILQKIKLIKYYHHQWIYKDASLLNKLDMGSDHGAMRAAHSDWKKETNQR